MPLTAGSHTGNLTRPPMIEEKGSMSILSTDCEAVSVSSPACGNAGGERIRVTQAIPAIFKSSTKSPQLAHSGGGRPASRGKAGSPAAGRVLANGTGRAATRGGGEVIELEHGITVYPAREEPGRWRAVWYENGVRQQCEAVEEAKLAARLEKVTERLAAGAPNMKRPGA